MINVTAIKLPKDFNAYKNIDGENMESLEPISKINIFVGSNNSGKSRFMRELSRQFDYEIKPDIFNIEQVNLRLMKIIESLENLIKGYGLISIEEISLDSLNEMRTYLTGHMSMNSDSYASLRFLFSKWSKLENISQVGIQHNGQHYWSTVYKNDTLSKIQWDSQNALQLLSEIPIYSEDIAPKQVYIPTLRGLRSFDNSHSDFYRDRTQRDYFPHQTSGDLNHLEEVERKRPEIFTGLTLYQEITDLLLGNATERQKIADYQKFISKTLFEGNEVTLIPNQKKTIIIVRIGDEIERPIYDLGDGIQSAIILTFLPFVRSDEQTFFFIEEPEIYLHPGLQRKILKFYSSPVCRNHTFFMTTHSNHFLDITIDFKEVSIFTFRKILEDNETERKTNALKELNANFMIELVDSGHESSLELLGVRNSSVFLVNATIWVEGITDRWYLRKMLKSYMDYLDAKDPKELKLRLEEDTHYSFVEYGGANITHWSFLDYEEKPVGVENLCAKAMVIIDGDGDSKKERKEKLKERLGDNLIILPCREIENSLPYDVIKQVVLEKENDENLEISDFPFESYKDEYLGTFIETKMLKNKPERQGVYRSKPQEGKSTTGTIKDKKGFCGKSLSKIKYTDLPEPIKEVIEKIYDFVYQQNSQ